MKANRIMEMERYIHQQNSVLMEELQTHFGISMNTVRRDVAQLVAQGSVKKVYGGVCARQTHPLLTPYDVRRISNLDAKTRIGQKAASLVHDGDVIFIDSGTTTLQMIDFLQDVQNLTILTNNLDVIIRATAYPNITLLTMPGHYDRKTNSFIDNDAAPFLRRYNIHTAFMAATGISSHGVSNSSPPEFHIKQSAVEASEQAILLVSHDKFGVTGLLTYAPVEAFAAVITDTRPTPEQAECLSRTSTKLLLAGK